MERNQLIESVKRHTWADVPAEDWFGEMFIDLKTFKHCLLATNKYPRFEWERGKDKVRFVGYEEIIHYCPGGCEYAWVESS